MGRHTHISHLLFTATAGLAIGAFTSADRAHAQMTAPANGDPSYLREQVLDIISQNYFDSTEPDQTRSTPDLVNRLDPFSYYETYKDYTDQIAYTENHKWHYGMDYLTLHGAVIVTSLAHNGPCYRAGIRSGDRIVEVNQISVCGNRALVDSLLAPRSNGTWFTIARPSTGERWSVCVPKVLPSPSDIAFATLLPDSVTGYVDLTGFADGTAGLFERSIDSLLECGMQRLVIDLRHNPGGHVREALAITNLFTNGIGKRMVSTWSVQYYENHQYWATQEAKYADLPLALLVDHRTCSAAGLFTGILQDYDRALIVGEPTLGKALVMQKFTLSNSDLVYLATSKFVLPSGRCIQRAYENDSILGGRTRIYENADNRKHELDRDIAPDDCVAYLTTRGRKLYSGEGIIPDIIVSENFAGEHPGWLLDSIEYAVIPYLEANATRLVAMGLDSFAHFFNVPRQLIASALVKIRMADTSRNKTFTARFAWEVPSIAMWYLGYELWDDQGWVAVRLIREPAIKQALHYMGKFLPAYQVASK